MNPGFCTWTKTGGVWTVTSSCNAGHVCMAMNSGSLPEPTTDGQSVEFENDGTIKGDDFGMTDAAFEEFLKHRDIKITKIKPGSGAKATSVAAASVAAASVAAAENGASIQVPCVPEIPIATTARPRFAPKKQI